jgi:DnaJ-class molecular chaperone
MTKNKPITHDLFGVDTCTHCDGEGKINLDVYDLNDVTKVAYTTTEECEMCKGTGVDT